MRRACLALGCILLSYAATAQSVEIVPTWPGIATTDPRSPLALVVRLENNLPDAHRIGFELELPSGWRQLVPDLPMIVQPGEASPRILSIFVPQEAQAADYQITATAVDMDTGEPLAFAAFDIRVLPYLELQIDGLDGSTHVLAGELIEVPIRVANRSNTTLRVNLALESRSFYSGEFEGAPDGQVILASNESVRVVARVRTPSVISRVENYTVNVVATGTPQNGDASSGVSVQASFRTKVEIIPVVSEDPPPFHRLPARIDIDTSHSFGPAWDGEVGFDLSGGGYLDENGDHRLDFVLSPSIDLNPLHVGSVNDTYRLNYTGRNIEALLGDNRYSISPLLGSNLSGRGVLGRYSTDPLQFTGLYYFPKAIGPSESTLGGVVDFRVPDPSLPSEYRYRTTLGALSLIGSDFAVGSYHEYVADSNTSVELELSGGTAGGYPFVWATMLGGEGLLADVQLSGSALYASPRFPGAVGDQVLVSGAATTVLNPSGVQLNARSSFQQENPQRTGSIAAQTIDAELSTKIPVRDRGAEISVGWRLRSRQDMMPDPDFSQLLNTVTAVTRIHMGDVYLGLDAGLGLDREVLADAWALSQRYNLALRWAATPQTTYNSHLAFSSRRSTHYPLDRSFSLGFVANQNWGPVDTSARTGLALASRDGEFDSLSSFVAAHADIPVWGDHTISLYGHIQYEFDSGGSGLTGGVSLGYSAPVNIPTTRKRGVGTVEGLAYMAETGLPADSVVIRVADRAVVTGSEGVFRLSTLQPGEYFLEVDTSRVGRGIIPDLPTPIKIPIRADETTHIDLPIVRGATISGAVALYAVPGERQGLLNTLLGDEEGEYEEDDLSLIGGLASAVVQISRDDEIRRVLTDRSGNFSLTDIRPGRWNVRIGNAQLPRYHRLVQDEFEVIIEPGDEATIIFQVFPIRRPLTMLSVSDIPITIATTEDEPTPVPPEESEPEPERTPPVLDSGAQDLVLAMRRYSVPDLNAPRLLQLPWGASPEESAELLAGRTGELVPGEMTRVGDDPEGMPLRTFRTSGVVQLGLLGDVELTFLDPKGDEDELFLVGVTVQIPGERNGLSPERLESVFRDLTTLFAGRWKVGEMESSVDGALDTRRARTGGIDISYVHDGANQTVTLDYRDSWYTGVAIDE